MDKLRRAQKVVAILIGLQSVHENRIYSLKIHCGPNYPDVPPEVTLVSKVNLPCVDQRNGKVGYFSHVTKELPLTQLLVQVDLSKLPSISTWKRDFTMETILIELRRFMAAPQNKKLPQPAEGTNF